MHPDDNSDVTAYLMQGKSQYEGSSQCQLQITVLRTEMNSLFYTSTLQQVEKGLLFWILQYKDG